MAPAPLASTPTTCSRRGGEIARNKPAKPKRETTRTIHFHYPRRRRGRLPTTVDDLVPISGIHRWGSRAAGAPSPRPPPGRPQPQTCNRLGGSQIGKGASLYGP